jgi:hypothetical protein
MTTEGKEEPTYSGSTTARMAVSVDDCVGKVSTGWPASLSAVRWREAKMNDGRVAASCSDEELRNRGVWPRDITERLSSKYGSRGHQVCTVQ